MKKFITYMTVAFVCACSATAQEWNLDITEIENDTDGLTKCQLNGTFTNNSDLQAAAVYISAVIKPEFIGAGLFDDLGDNAFSSNLVYRLAEPGDSKDARLYVQSVPCDYIETMYIYTICEVAGEPVCDIPLVVTGLDDFTVPVVFEAPPA